jgi:hypothetical protein
MQEINYGRIKGLQVRDGEPLFNPPPTVLRLFLFSKNGNGPNAARNKGDFALKNKMVELFEVFDREQTLSIQEIMIDDGLPIRMTVADVVRA